MKNDSKRTLTPKLRFTEFRAEPGWEEKPLSSVCEVNPDNDELPDSFIYIDLESVEGGRLTARNIIAREGAPSRAQRLLRAGDVIYQMVRPYQRNNLFFNIDDGNQYVASTGYGQLRTQGSPAFLFQLIHTDSFVSKVIAKCTGSNYPAINSSDLAAIAVVVPRTLTEQKKIADSLSSLDVLIAAEGRKLEALRAHKKGLMQQLFPCPDETRPRLRLPEFRKAPEWEEAKLGQLGSLVSGLTYSPSDVQRNGLLVLRSSNIQNGEIALEDCVYVVPTVKGANLSKPNDILICVRNGSKSLIGKNAMIPEGMPKCTHGAFMTVLRSSTAHFVHVLLQTAAFQKQVAADLGATINSINGNQLLKYRFMVPKPAEQKRIADCLASIGGLIAAQSQKLVTLQTQKKGLMQQLFPSPEEAEA